MFLEVIVFFALSKISLCSKNGNLAFVRKNRCDRRLDGTEETVKVSIPHTQQCVHVC
jgi:hypothetical protein